MATRGERPVRLLSPKTIAFERDSTISSCLSALQSSSTRSQFESFHNANSESVRSMSSADAYSIFSHRRAQDTKQLRHERHHKLLGDLERSLQQSFEESITDLTESLTASMPPYPRSVPNTESPLSLPDGPINLGLSAIRSRRDREIHQATVKPYQRYTSASTRSTAIHCLEEARYFQKKPWMKQVAISTDMGKYKVQRRIARAADSSIKASSSVPARAISSFS